ncbi:MAG: Gfo/Idh/MocA family oxidoreductase [Chloroflexi bacterium]|nr:Gfo/Idh/MocA family oxidoreductase [Chloroflexota bacterium]
MALRVAVAGLGHRGTVWARLIQTTPGLELVALADVSPAALSRATSRLGLDAARSYEDVDRALSEANPDALVVATPPDLHVAPCEAALARRVALLVEKPFTCRLDEAHRLVLAAEAANVPLLVAQNYRYLRVHRTVRQVIRSGRLGQVGLVVGQYYRVPHPLPPSLARLPHVVLWGMAVHHLDALRFVLGREATGAIAESFNVPWRSRPDGATFQALLRFKSGIRALYSATYESSGHEYFERGQEFYQRVVGERGTLHVFHRWLVLCERGKLPRLVRRGPRPEPEESILLRQLERAAVAGEPAECNGRDNLQTVALVEACLRSLTERRWINPQELLRELD